MIVLPVGGAPPTVFVPMQPSPAAQSHPGILLVLCGPSGVGKSTISLRLAAETHLTYIVSATTRAHRVGDKVGKAYDYVERDEFFRRLDSDAFLEYAQIYDEYYGTPKHPCLDYLADGQDVLLEIDVQGALQVRYQYPDALLIFIVPPEEQTLRRRLTDRARENAEAIDRRFRAAKREIHMARGSKAFDYFVTNDTLDRAVQEIQTILKQRKIAASAAIKTQETTQ